MTGFTALSLVLAMLGLAPAASAATAPVRAGSVSNSTSLSSATAVAVAGHYAYVTAYHPGTLTAVDISNPATPVVAGQSASAPSLIGGSNVAIAGGYAYVVSKNRNASPTSNDDGNGNSLTILDIHTDPAHPAIVGSVHDSSRLFGAQGIAVSGNFAYVAYQGLIGGQPGGPDTSNGGFTVIDIADPAHPAIVANLDDAALPAPYTGQNLFDSATTVALSGHFAYVTAQNTQRFTVLDVSNPASPAIVGTMQDSANMPAPADVAVSGNFAYVADQTPGSTTEPQFTVVDVSDPTHPHAVAELRQQPKLDASYRIRIRGNLAYVAASGAEGVAAIDISKPTAPRLAGAVFDGAHMHRVIGLDLDATGTHVIAASPYLSSEQNVIYPPYPDSGPSAPLNTGTISAITLDPTPIGVTIASSSEPAKVTAQRTAAFTFAASDDVATLGCSLDGAAPTPCATATSASYSALATGRHTFAVTATDSAGHTGTASYTWTIGTVPVQRTGPSISGTATQGRTLTAHNGSFTATPAPKLSDQWQRCNARGSRCAAIKNAHGARYTLVAADVGHRIRVVVTADNGAASTKATSPTTRVVAPAVALRAVLSGLRAGVPHLRLTARSAAGSPAISRITIALPSGLRFASLPLVVGALRLTDGRGHRIHASLSIHKGVLTIVLRKPGRTVTATFGPAALVESAALQARVRRHRATFGTVRASARNTKRQVSRAALRLRLK